MMRHFSLLGGSGFRGADVQMAVHLSRIDIDDLGMDCPSKAQRKGGLSHRSGTDYDDQRVEHLETIPAKKQQP